MESKKSILITGGSSGIGLETAKIFAAKNYRIYITGLDEEELASAEAEIRKASVEVDLHTLCIDLTADAAEKKLHQWAAEKGFEPHILINNAGYGTYGKIWEINQEREENMMHLLMMTPYRLTRLFLPDIMKNNGVIINVVSIAAFQPNPSLTTYGACKSFLFNWTIALNEELKDAGSAARAVAVCPTPARTNFARESGMEGTQLFNSWMAVEAGLVAQTIWRASQKKPTYVVPGRFYHFVSHITRLLPYSLVMGIGKRYM
jgi:short-subunit dehydrogenase